jgi:uncharacterized membrane protein YozB (DUF420 family)
VASTIFDMVLKPSPPLRFARAAVLTAITAFACCFILYVALTALSEAFVNDQFPETLAIKLEQWPILFPVHMISGALALLLIPMAILARARPILHRSIGRIAAIDVTVAGLTAFPVAWIAPISPWSAAGFIAQAGTWMTFLGLGIWHVRNRRREQHRTCMLLVAAITSGAVFFRVYLALWALFGDKRHFSAFYAFDSWIAWLGPLTFTWLLLRWHKRTSRQGTARMMPA